MTGNRSVVGCAWAAVMVLAAIAAVGEAAVAIQPPLEKPAKYAYIQGCYSAKYDMVLPYNINVNPIDGVNCVRYSCEKSGYTYIYTCGVTEVPENCLISRDLTEPYPGCCGKPVCQTFDPPSEN